MTFTHSKLGTGNDLALIRIKLFMTTILTEITAMKVSLGRKIKSNGVETVRLSGVPWKPDRLNAASSNPFVYRPQWPFLKRRSTSQPLRFAPVSETPFSARELNF